MQLAVYMQDPTYTETTYLYEAILAAARTAESWRGYYAFATRDGIDHLIEDDVILELMNRGGEIHLVVGLDAITNRPTLERLQELDNQHPNFTPRVFWNQYRALFHPKISYFDLPDGGRILIVGSGNLTPGGLRTNFEAYTVITADQAEDIDLTSFTEFAHRHAAHIGPIEDHALERAEANKMRPIGRSTRSQPPSLTSVPSVPPPGFGQILIAQVPKAGGRWAQLHLNAEVVQTFFKLRHDDSERAYLTNVLLDGSRQSIEVRPCVFSQSNRNYRIEIGGAKGLQYPSDNRRPLIVFYERQLRTFDYLLLMPGDDGHSRLLELSNTLPSPGRGLPRVVTDIPTLSNAWPQCPLLLVDVEDHQVL